MHRAIVRKLVRRTALILIIVLQLTNFYLQIAYIWTPPQKSNRKLMTMAAFSQPFFISISCFAITERNVNVKLGRFLVRGLGIEVLLWAIVVGSAALVGMDMWHTPDGLMGSVQLLIVDVLMFMDMSSAVGLVNREEYRDQPAADEKTGEMEV